MEFHNVLTSRSVQLLGILSENSSDSHLKWYTFYHIIGSVANTSNAL